MLITLPWAAEIVGGLEEALRTSRLENIGEGNRP
jgi:hypothetical protein